ncbi:hypothetical protein QBC35DRAFT_286973 [Podospora australis]|uniref:Rhodopsin domain-containing protein n=1 Tax=Podospora australis TaxID=1536484 RepID=A0AAN7AGQ9_9PEZI|nr:hypothetical protein QBC35DRAFT_286973 [Podospora australis]
MVQLDNFSTQQKQTYILVTVVIGVVLSTVSHAGRIYARFRIVGGLRLEDYLMTAGILLSYGTVVCLLYGLPNQGVPIPLLPPGGRRDFLLMIWVIQKLQPPTLFFIKASFIVFHCHIFQSRTFRRVSWAVGILTGVWAVANVLGTTFQCKPPSLFWDKTQTGECLKDPVHRMGIPNAILSSVGDIIIFVMPIPPLTKLKVPRRTKIGLLVVFGLGVFVLVASFFRWIALIGADRDIFNSSQVQVGVWTYLEISVAITCGNLPFMAPMIGCMGPTRRSTRGNTPNWSGNESYPRKGVVNTNPLASNTAAVPGSHGRRSTMLRASWVKPLPTIPLGQQGMAPGGQTNTVVIGGEKTAKVKDGFTRLYDSGSDVDIEMQAVTVTTTISQEEEERKGKGVSVVRDIEVGHKE